MDDLVEAPVQADQVDERAMEFRRAADGAVGGELSVGELIGEGVEAADLKSQSVTSSLLEPSSIAGARTDSMTHSAIRKRAFPSCPEKREPCPVARRFPLLTRSSNAYSCFVDIA